MALSDDERAAILRPVWEALVTEAEARLRAVVDHATAGGSRIVYERIEGTVPDNAHGTIRDESVVVSFPSYSFAADLETLLGEIIADLSDEGAAVAVEEADGSPAGTVRTLVFPDGSVTIDAATETATVAFAAAAIEGRYRQFVTMQDGTDWGFVYVEVGGQKVPVTALYDLE